MVEVVNVRKCLVDDLLGIGTGRKETMRRVVVLGTVSDLEQLFLRELFRNIPLRGQA